MTISSIHLSPCYLFEHFSKKTHAIWPVIYDPHPKISQMVALLSAHRCVITRSSLVTIGCLFIHQHSRATHTVQEWLEIKFYCLWLFSTFHIHTWWGQSKYVRKFEISRANFEKFKILYILKFFLWILCINMQNCSNSKELRQKSSKNLWTISKLVQEPLN